MHNTKEIQDWLTAHIANLLQVAPETIDIRESFSSYGLSSLDVVTLSGDLEEFLGRRLSPTLAYDYPNVLSLSRFLTEPTKNATLGVVAKYIPTTSTEPIAVIGIACRFPGATDAESFWELLRKGEDAISEIPADRWEKKDFYDPDSVRPGKSISYWGGFLNNIDQFDPYFFGISPAEAKHMDPQQRLLLELSYEALDDAGQAIQDISGSKTGVFVGISVNEYSLLQFANPTQISSHSGTGSALSIAANRISYTYNFHGPSIAIDTACSSSLAAVHLACQSLRNGESTMAIAGGVNIILSPAHSIAFTKAGVLAPDGRCKSFDAGANGYVRGEGGGLIVLKPLSSAIADGYPIHAVILGSAMMQDGHTNGLIAPSREAQEALLKQAYESAGVLPGRIQYVEAHGTGTILGDAMEAEALGAVVGVNRTNGPCLIGSVKSNIGHLESAAGIAGLIKVILSLRHRTIPPSIHYDMPNPHIPFDKLNIRVSSELKPWPCGSDASLAGVSSFGFGGTNVHVVVSEGVDLAKESKEQVKTTKNDCHLLPLSANNNESLQLLAASFHKLLAADSYRDGGVNDICYGASLRRSQQNFRLAAVGNSQEELLDALQAFIRAERHPNVFTGNELPGRRGRLAFVFSGQGGQWYRMGAELLKQEPVFHDTIRRIENIIQARFGWSLIDVLGNEEFQSRLDEIDVVQPALFAIQVALAELWQSWGIAPDAVVGHSMGEIAAAHVAGILSLEDAIQVVCYRSRLLKNLRGQGSMLITELSPAQAEELLTLFENDISIAVINGPTSTVLSGNLGTLKKVMDFLERQNLFCKFINVDVASHSPQMDSLRPELLDGLSPLNPRTSTIPIYSTVTGEAAHDVKFNADYWMANLRKPVLFSDAVSELSKSGHSYFIEIGPHPVLLGAIQQSLQATNQRLHLFASLSRDEPGWEVLRRSLAELYTEGFPVDWKRLYRNANGHVRLPLIPWQRQRYWMDIQHASSNNHPNHSGNSHPLLGDRINLANSPSSFIWQRTLGEEVLNFLSDHRIANEIVFPAAAYIEMALQCAKEAGLSNSHTIADFVFKERLVLDGGKRRTIQSQLSRTENNNYIFSVYSQTSDDENWTLYASAMFVDNQIAGDIEASSQTDDGIRQASTSQYTSDEFYHLLQASGLNYGPAFRGIQHIWNKGDQSLAYIKLPESPQYQSAYQLQPALLDACLQLIAAQLANSIEPNFYLPAGCKQIRFFSRPGGKIWSRLSMQTVPSTGSDVVHADIRLLGDNGQTFAELIGFRLQRTSRPARPLSEQGNWLYHLRWEVKPTTGAFTTEGGEARHWLILADDNDVGKQLGKQIEASGGHCHYSFCNQSIEQGRNGTDDIIGKCIDEISAPLHGIIHLWSLSTPLSSAELAPTSDVIQNYGCNSMLRLVQALAKRLTAFPRLWVVTKGAQSVRSGEPVAIEQSALWGLAKVLNFELPEFKCRSIDLDPLQSHAESVSLLTTEISTHDREDQIAFRDGIRYVLRLLPFKPTRSVGAACMSFRTSGTYLITGGLGGLGLQTAEWMSKHGARHIVLLGRSEPSAHAMNVIDRLRHDGIEVVIANADVSDLFQLKHVVDEIKNNMPTLSGVVHAAGVLDDGSLLNLTPERMKKVMGPKVDGTWNLHLVTLNLPLDFFVLFSSAVSVLGSPGQGNYAAASAYLDAFAYFRHNLGLPAISINWGPWADIGLAAQTVERLTAQQASTQHLIKVIKIEEGLQILEQLLTESTPQIMVLPFDLKHLIELYPTAAGLPFLEEIGGGDTHGPRLYARPKLRQQYVAPRNKIERKLAQLWQQTLHIDMVGVHDSFFELGGDSVLAAQILTSAQKSFGIRISPQDAFKAFTIEKLAEMLEQQMLNQIEKMSEEEAQQLLSRGN